MSLSYKTSTPPNIYCAMCVLYCTAATPLNIFRTILHSRLHMTSLAARLPVDELALTWIMAHGHAKGLCASEIDQLRI